MICYVTIKGVRHVLIQFSVENFCSLKDKLVLSLQPSDDEDHRENLIKDGDYSGLNMVALYGANASGKSNLHKAMTAAILLIRQSNLRQVGEKLFRIVPFKLDNNSLNQPTSFEFEFVAGDSQKYIYGFSANTDKIIEEYLYKFDPSADGNYLIIFERQGEEFTFGEYDADKLSVAQKMNTENKLFLATATAWNVPCTTIPYMWFANKVDTYTSGNDILPSVMNMYHQDMYNNIEFTKELLKKTDINIEDLFIEEQKNDYNPSMPFPWMNPANSVGIAINGEQYSFKITTSHQVINKDNTKQQYLLNLAEESLGTRQLFYFAPLLKETFDKGKTIFIDELENSLHPAIARFLINLFRNDEYNRNGAQLIFTTHETTLLSMDIFRNDQIYFTEKDNKTGITDLYSLDDFPKVANEDVEKGYLLGRYGAIPFLKTEDVVL